MEGVLTERQNKMTALAAAVLLVLLGGLGQFTGATSVANPIEQAIDVE